MDPNNDTTISNPTTTQSLSKKAIHILNTTNGLCAHPIHYHSFTAIGSSSIFAPAAGISLLSAPKCLFVGTFHKCIACHNRLGSRPQKKKNHEDNNVGPPSSNTNDDSSSSSGMEMLYCVACGVYAHRSCAFARDTEHSIDNLPGCEVNRPIVEAAGGFQWEHKSSKEVPSLSESTRSKSSWSFFGRRTANDDHDGKSCSEMEEKTILPNQTAPEDGKALECPEPSSPILGSESKEADCKYDTTNDNEQQSGDVNNANHESSQTTTSNQSNSSWSFFGKRHPIIKESTKELDKSSSKTKEMDSDSEHPQTWCPHITISRPESPISWSIFGTRAAKRKPTVDSEPCKSKEDDTENDTAKQNADQSHDDDNSHEIDDDMTHSALEDMLSADHDAVDEVKISDPPPQGAFQTSIEIIRKTSQTTASIPKAYSIGMVAGGVAGLAIAGPAGVIVGSQIGKTVLAVGAAVEGGMSIGVLAMGLVAASKYSHKTKEQRELELPGHEDSTLVLVRPDIAVDPIWADYTAEARELWEKMNNNSLKSSWGSGFGSMFSSDSNEHTAEIRYHRDVDIIAADGSELAMREKVFLLVSRILNDKISLPGYVYRFLIRKCIVRESDQECEADQDGTTDQSTYHSHSCKADAHGVIKYVTATLLEVRKGLASSPALTEMCASAVEVLVFGDMYDGVFNEIVKQTMEQRERFLSKVEYLELQNGPNASSTNEPREDSQLSKSAISSLKMLPEARTTAEKLFHLVQFLEYVSLRFSEIFQDRCIDADVLLSMVCQHILAASDVNLHAEIAFIEEFSRDEQLLRGKEGYALITMQASLHYLQESGNNYE